MTEKWLHSMRVNVDNDGNPKVVAPSYANMAVTVLTVDDTAGGKSLATLKGSALMTDLIEFRLIPHGDAGTVNWDAGDSASASASTAEVPLPSLELPIGKTLADTIALFAAGGAEKVTLIELGD